MNRCIYKMVGLHESGKEQLVYIGQSTDFERRVLQHKEELRQALIRDRYKLTKPFRRKYEKLKQHFRTGRVVFEKIAEGNWTWEEAIIRETNTILEFRKNKKISVLNTLDNPRSGSMPEGRVARLDDGRVALSVIAGLKPGFEAVLIDKNKREIVRVHTKVSGPVRGIDVWTFVRTGDRWTAGNMPRAIGLRIYRGALLELFKKTGKELDQDRSKPEEHVRVLKPLSIVSVAPPAGTGEMTPAQIRMIGNKATANKPRKKPRKAQSPTLIAAAAAAAQALGGPNHRLKVYGNVPKKLRSVLNAGITEWERELMFNAVAASKGSIGALRQMRALIRGIASGSKTPDRVLKPEAANE